MILRVAVSLMAIAYLATAQNKLTKQERKDGFQLLFDGKTLSHWHTVKRRPNNASWTVEKGVLSYEKGESWLATDDTYYDFVLRLEYKTADKTDSGVFVNASGAGNPGTTGVELNLISDAGKPATARSTSSMWDIVAPTKNLNKPDGEWNTVEVTVLKRQLTAVWNGEKVLDVSLDDPQYPKLATRGAYGHIGLQAHAFGEPAAFRNIRIKPIRLGPPDPPAAQ
jgi:hypothetical protein